jgi:hypothetical protein
MAKPSPQHHVRTEFSQSSCTVFAYPLSGGIILKNVVGVELDFLGLPRTETVLCHDDGEMEDTPALRMLQIGARWWPSLNFYKRYAFSDHPYGYHYPSDRYVGYPSTSGILLLELFAESSVSWLEGLDPPQKPETWARVLLSSSMDERCTVLTEFGATFYEDSGQCDKLPKTLEEGVAEGKRYERLILKMKDDAYLEEWMESL